MVSGRAVAITQARLALGSQNCNSSGIMENFCWKCNLRTGTLCCGIASLVLSTVGIITNGAIHTNGYYSRYYALERSLMFEEVLMFAVSAFCIHGALKEYRYSLLPWLIVTGLTITILFFTGLYYILFGRFDFIMIGLLLLIISCVLVYGWMGVLSYYNQLRDQEECPQVAGRSYIDPAAVTNPAAFTAPPSYSVAVIGGDNPAFEEKPPSYEEAEASKRQQSTV